MSPDEIDDLARLDSDECWAFLSRHYLGRVVTIDAGGPAVFPVNYALDGRSVGVPDRAWDEARSCQERRDGGVRVDEAEPMSGSGTSVVVHGTLRKEADEDARARLMTLPLRPWAAGDRDHFVRVIPTWVTGRSILPHTEGEGLGADAG
jgi:nitroimidazol reductase NimA-like FMN-containing flavoprotein (pyridoxamine 5'-phosphate oxidase superfamily)